MTRTPFARSVPRAAKRTAGATEIGATPLRIYAADVALDAAEKDALRVRLGRRLRRFAPHLTSVVVRFIDINGPRGGIDTLCRIKVSVAEMGHLVFEARAGAPEAAAMDASRLAKISLGRALSRRGKTNPRATARGGDGRAPSARPSLTRGQRQRPEGGSLIGRRVGRSRANLERATARPEKVRRDAWTDTSLPGVSETDRKAGGGSTAARNTRLRTNRAAVTLEDSAGKPSRKSTRKSANRLKGGSKKGRREKRKLHAPSSRARRA